MFNIAINKFRVKAKMFFRKYVTQYNSETTTSKHALGLALFKE